jgi:putative transcriptional regulator
MKKTEFSKLMESVKQAGQIKKGRLKPGRTFRYDAPDISAIRKALHVSQKEFAALIGVSVDTVQNWEQGRRKPRGPARALLRVAWRKPKAVLEALHA